MALNFHANASSQSNGKMSIGPNGIRSDEMRKKVQVVLDVPPQRALDVFQVLRDDRDERLGADVGEADGAGRGAERGVLARVAEVTEAHGWVQRRAGPTARSRPRVRARGLWREESCSASAREITCAEASGGGMFPERRVLFIQRGFPQRLSADPPPPHLAHLAHEQAARYHHGLYSLLGDRMREHRVQRGP